MNSGDYPHVRPELRAYLGLEPEERLALSGYAVPANYPRADTHIKRILRFATMPRVDRMPCGLIFGPSNNGKTTLLLQFESEISKLPLDLEPGMVQTWVRILAPSHADETRLYLEILTALHAPMARTSTSRELAKDALFHLRSAGVQLLIIDELQHLITGTRTAIRVTMNAIKNLSTDLKMSVVGSGLPTAYNAILADPQLENRFYPMELPCWTYGDDFKQLLTRLESRLLLRHPSNLASTSLAKVIHTRTTGLLGEVTEFLRSATECALREGKESLTTRELSAADYLGPEERRQRYIGH